jgi:hypothetical protein
VICVSLYTPQRGEVSAERLTAADRRRVIEEFRPPSRRADARVIAYTANRSLADNLIKRVFVAVLPKPSTPDVLLATVREAAGL